MDDQNTNRDTQGDETTRASAPDATLGRLERMSLTDTDDRDPAHSTQHGSSAQQSFGDATSNANTNRGYDAGTDSDADDFAEKQFAEIKQGLKTRRNSNASTQGPGVTNRVEKKPRFRRPRSSQSGVSSYNRRGDGRNSANESIPEHSRHGTGISVGSSVTGSGSSLWFADEDPSRSTLFEEPKEMSATEGSTAGKKHGDAMEE